MNVYGHTSVCEGNNRLPCTFTHTRTRECDRGECGGIERGCRDKELRQRGREGGGFAAGVGAGGRVSGLGETGGCSTARYGVTASKIPSSPDFRNAAACPKGSAERLESERFLIDITKV